MPILTDDEITALLKACAVPRGRAAVFHRTVVLGRRSTPCRSSRSAARASRRSVRSRAETSDSEKTFQEQVLGLCPVLTRRRRVRRMSSWASLPPSRLMSDEIVSARRGADPGAAPCLTPSDDGGFVIDEAEVFYWGRCPPCAAGQPPASPDRLIAQGGTP